MSQNEQNAAKQIRQALHMVFQPEEAHHAGQTLYILVDAELARVEPDWDQDYIKTLESLRHITEHIGKYA